MRLLAASAAIALAAAAAVAQDESPAEKFVKDAEAIRVKQAQEVDAARGLTRSPALRVADPIRAAFSGAASTFPRPASKKGFPWMLAAGAAAAAIAVGAWIAARRRAFPRR